MQDIVLSSHNVEAHISPQGGWLKSLTSHNESILFDMSELMTVDGSLKTRGGSHVCLPNFGPGGNSGLMQHGFGRTTPWTITNQTSKSVTLALNNGPHPYKNLDSHLTYNVQAQSIIMELHIENNGKTPLAIAPAFHPYFALPPNTKELTINNQLYQPSQLGDAEFIYSEHQTYLSWGDRMLTLTSENLPKWAIWTDQLGDYICVEPTAAGNAFIDDSTIILAPQESQDYSLMIEWLRPT